jgi:hypothetical protein
MAGRRPRVTQVPDPADDLTWKAFVHWLRHYDVRGAGDRLEIKTLRGWEPVQATDWVLRLPGRELYRMSDERWRDANPGGLNQQIPLIYLAQSQWTRPAAPLQ